MMDNQRCPAKRDNRKRCSRPNWLNLGTDVLELVPRNLALVDLVRFQAVCSLWRGAVKSYMSSPLYSQIPPVLRLETDKDIYGLAHRFYSLAHGKHYRFKETFGGFSEAFCKGSSHGWLVIFDLEVDPHLVHPFSGAQIQLAPLNTLIPFTYLALEGNEGEEESPERYLILKAIVTSNPSRNKNFKVVVMLHHAYSSPRLALCKLGDKTWTRFGSRGNNRVKYGDILYHRDQLYALCLFSCTVEVWDFHGGNDPPTKVKNIKYLTSLSSGRYLRPQLRWDLVSHLHRNCSFVESLGEIYLLLRFRGKKLYTIALYRLSPSGRRWIPVRALPSPIRNPELWDTQDGLLSSNSNTPINYVVDYLSQSLVLLGY